MSRHVRYTRGLLAAAAILGSTATNAWTPYGYGPYGPDQPPTGPAPGSQAPTEQGAGIGESTPPGYPPYGAVPDFQMPGDPSLEPEGYGPQSFGFSPYRPGSGFPGMARSGLGGPSGPLQISRYATEDAYIVDIQLNGMKPEDVQVSARGSWIRVSRNQSRQETREDSFEQGRGYSRSYSFSSGSASRRFNVPRDADLEGLTREEKEGVLRILIPRRHQ